LALADYDDILVEPVSSATIVNNFVPPIASGSDAGVTLANTKKVDFVLTLDVGFQFVQSDGEDPLSTAIRSVLLHEPFWTKTINQSLYPPLQFNPIGVSIEAKTASGSYAEGRAQLATWAAAWHRRWACICPPSLVESSAGGTMAGGAEAGSIITLPLLIISEHEWSLSFAVDRGSHIVCIAVILTPRRSRHPAPRLTFACARIFLPTSRSATRDLLLGCTPLCVPFENWPHGCVDRSGNGFRPPSARQHGGFRDKDQLPRGREATKVNTRVWAAEKKKLEDCCQSHSCSNTFTLDYGLI
jgi:hypothetical protein